MTLSEAVTAYRQAGIESLSAEDGAALDRLAASADAARVFAASPLAADDKCLLAEQRGRIFVSDCLSAVRIDREHRAQIERLKKAAAGN